MVHKNVMCAVFGAIRRVPAVARRRDSSRLSGASLFRRAYSNTPALRRRLLVLTCVAVASAILPLVVPVLVARVVDGLARGDTFGELLPLLAAAALIPLLGALVDLTKARMASAIGFTLVQDLQTRLFDRLLTMPLGFFTTVEPGAVASRVTNDVNAMEPLSTTIFPAYISSVAVLTTGAAVLLVSDYRLAATLLLVPAVLVLVRYSEKKINSSLAESFNLTHAASTNAERVLNLDGIVLAREAGQSYAESQRFGELTQDLRRVATRLGFWRGSIGAQYAAVFGVVTGLALIGGANLVATDRMSLGTFLLFLLYIRLIQAPTQEIIGLRYPVLRAGIALDRVEEVLSWEPGRDLADLDSGRALPNAQGSHMGPTQARPKFALVFESVSMTYPSLASVAIPGLSHAGRPVGSPVDRNFTFLMEAHPVVAPESSSEPRRDAIRNLSFAVQHGETVAVVGASGAGKSTAAMLAAGLLYPSAGKVVLGGRETTSATEAELCRSVAYIAQSTPLLHDTIRANLSYGVPDLSDDQLHEACERARLSDVVARGRDGLDTVIGERGHRLSGGERQRIALGRAFLRQTDLVVLDEATAHLDVENEQLIHEALRDAFAGRGVLIVAHRLSTIFDADRIIVLEEGSVVEHGSHVELMDMPGSKYSSLVRRSAGGYGD
jgi:ATP-binding cassette subfamily B protein